MTVTFYPKPDSPLPMVEIPLLEYSLMCRQVGFLEGTLSGLLFVTDDFTNAVIEALSRYDEQFMSPMATVEIQPATVRAPASGQSIPQP